MWRLASLGTSCTWENGHQGARSVQKQLARWPSSGDVGWRGRGTDGLVWKRNYPASDAFAGRGKSGIQRDDPVLVDRIGKRMLLDLAVRNEGSQEEQDPCPNRSSNYTVLARSSIPTSLGFSASRGRIARRRHEAEAVPSPDGGANRSVRVASQRSVFGAMRARTSVAYGSGPRIRRGSGRAVSSHFLAPRMRFATPRAQFDRGMPCGAGRNTALWPTSTPVLT